MKPRLAAALAILGAAGVSRADEKEWTLAAQPGFSLLRVGDRSTWGGGGGLDVAYGLTDALSLRATGALAAHAVAADPARSPAVPGGAALAWHAGLGVSYAIDIVRVVPYLDFSLGLVGTRVPGAAGPVTDHQLGIEFGLGVDYLYSRRFSFGVVARYHAPLTAASQIPAWLYAGPRLAVHFGD